MSEPAAPYSHAVQVLRAVSAIMVMVHHVLSSARNQFDFAHYPHDVPLEWSVDLFFVISGAVIIISTDAFVGKPGCGWRYLRARLTRVVPLYWAATTLMALLLLAISLRHSAYQPDLAKIFASYAFWPYLGTSNDWYPTLGPGWTLNFEMFFYLTFWVILLFCRTMGSALITLTVAFTSLFLLGALSTEPLPMPLRFWADKDILNFVAGAMLGYLWLRTRWRLKHGWLLGVAAFVAMVPATPVAAAHEELGEWIGMGLAATIVGAGLMGLTTEQDRRMPRFAVALGDSSYSLYLSHLFVIYALAEMWRRAGLSDAVWPFIALCCVASVVIGHLLWIWGERPGLRAIRRLIPASRLAPTMPQPR